MLCSLDNELGGESTCATALRTVARVLTPSGWEWQIGQFTRCLQYGRSGTLIRVNEM